MRFTSAILAFICAFLGGCDYLAQKELKPGESTVADVRKYMGEPETIWEEPDGTRVYEYPKGPTGRDTYMIVIDANGIFQSMTNVLVPEQFAKVTPGTLKADVRRLLGPPTEVESFERLQQEVWTYKHAGRIDSTEFFHVYFDPAGKVTKTQVVGDDRPGN